MTSSVSSLKERARVKRGFAGLLSRSARLATCWTGPRALSAGGLGPWSAFPRLLPVRVSGWEGQGPGGARPASPAPQGVLDASGREPIIGRRGQAGGRLWWLRAPWAALVLAGAWLRSSLRVSPRRGAAGHGAGPRGQRDQSDAAGAARGGARHGSDH